MKVSEIGGAHTLFLKPNLKSFSQPDEGKTKTNVCQHYPRHKGSLSSSSFCPPALYNRPVRFASLMLFLSNANQLVFFLCSGSYRWHRTRQLQRGETAHTSLFHFCVSATWCNSFFLLVRRCFRLHRLQIQPRCAVLLDPRPVCLSVKLIFPYFCL